MHPETNLYYLNKRINKHITSKYSNKLVTYIQQTAASKLNSNCFLSTFCMTIKDWMSCKCRAPPYLWNQKATFRALQLDHEKSPWAVLLCDGDLLSCTSGSACAAKPCWLKACCNLAQTNCPKQIKAPSFVSQWSWSGCQGSHHRSPQRATQDQSLAPAAASRTASMLVVCSNNIWKESRVWRNSWIVESISTIFNMQTNKHANE